MSTYTQAMAASTARLIELDRQLAQATAAHHAAARRTAEAYYQPTPALVPAPDARTQWESAIAAQRATGKTRSQAILAVIKNQPDLYLRMSGRA